jgi:iron uptake system component EfeO
MNRTPIFLFALSLAVGCSESTDDDPETEATLRVKDYVTVELDALVAASEAIQAAAPAPDADGWNATADAAAVTEMRAHWHDARVSYERIEGAIAVLFPDLDAATDERYDGFIAEGADSNLFDGMGVTGVHGIERILWADSHPAWVVEFEEPLPGYIAASFPTTQADAQAFKDGLAAQLVTDTRTMADSFEPLALDPSAAYGGVTGSMAEQLEKVSLAATGEDESRYAQHTLADMRANLEGGREIYEAFSPWLQSIDGGAAIDAEIIARFDAVQAQYDALSGDALPAVPEGWDESAPSEEHLATPYGQLWQFLSTEADPTAQGGMVERMIAAAELMDIPVVL